jgi:TatD DNase family protein
MCFSLWLGALAQNLRQLAQMFIDTHTHLYLEHFDEDREAMLQRALNKGIAKFYLPAIDSSYTEKMFELELSYPGQCFAMMGLHPCSVNENFEQELLHVENWMRKRRFAAVGEIGLDFYWDKSFILQQYTAFKRQMDLALEFNLPIVIHSRDAMQECIDTVAPYAARGLTGIFHCFGGTLAQANQVISMGFKLGIGGVLTYKNSGLDKVLADISLKHIVLETDAPYLTPQPFRGKRNESSYLIYVAEKIAEVKGLTIDEVEKVTTSNAIQVFRE